MDSKNTALLTQRVKIYKGVINCRFDTTNDNNQNIKYKYSRNRLSGTQIIGTIALLKQNVPGRAIRI